MDDRTTLLLQALDEVGVALLLELLGGPTAEADLLEALPGTTQSTVNRRLNRLGKARLVAQEPGNRKAPGRPWIVVHPAETEVLLTALFRLADVIDAEDRSRRLAAVQKLKRARADRIGLRIVEDEPEVSGQ